MSEFEGKVALISGGTSGIGGVTADLIARKGAVVVLAARSKKRGLEYQNKIREQGGKALFVPCDVTKPDEVEHLYAVVREEYGRLDILINSAGILRTETLENITDENWDAVYNTNLKSVVYMCQMGMPLLLRAPSGGIILNIASETGLQSVVKGRSNYAYATAKAAQIQFTQMLAKNYGPTVRINCLCPGPTATDLWENKDFERFKSGNLLHKVFTAEDVAKVALFMVSDAASSMTGSIVVADGGAHLVG